MITDIHTHIIPDVDDGALDLSMSLDIIEEAVKQGITKIFATSHHFAYLDGIHKVLPAYHLVEDAIQQLHIPIQLYLGCEILCLPRWMNSILEGLRTGEYPSMNGTKYVLIEFTIWNIEFHEVMSCIDQLLKEGWIPVIAHIERYLYSFASISHVRKMKEKGCLIQINAYSVYEEIDEQVKTFAMNLLSHRLVDFIGTDSHGPLHRPPMMENGVKFMYEKFDADYIDQITYKNADTYFELDKKMSWVCNGV